MAENIYTRSAKVLNRVVEETLKGSFAYCRHDAEIVYLIEKGFVEVNQEMIDNDGGVATRATEAGIEKSKGAKFAPKEKNEMNGFVIENIAVEKKRRSSGKASIYPFELLEVGQSFFVPATEKRPEPWVTMASIVGTAIKRFSEVVLDENGQPVMREIVRGPNKGELTQETKSTKVFVLTKDSKDGVDGARIGRTE